MSIASSPAAALQGFLASVVLVACSSSTTVVSGTEDGAAGAAATTSSTGPAGGGGAGAWNMDGGTDPKPTCDCPPAPYAINLEGDGQPQALPLPYLSDLVMNCEPPAAYLIAHECYGIGVWYSIAGCAGPDMAASCAFVSDDTFPAPLESHYLDASGTKWTLTGVEFSFSEPSLLEHIGQAVGGAFQATATGEDGQQLSLHGSMLVCYVLNYVCPE